MSISTVNTYLSKVVWVMIICLLNGCAITKNNTETLTQTTSCTTSAVNDTTRQPCVTDIKCIGASANKWLRLRTAKITQYHEYASEWSCSIDPSDWVEIIQQTALMEPKEICFYGRLNSLGGPDNIGKRGFLQCTLTVEETDSP